MEPEGSSPHWQELATYLYPEPDWSSLCPQSTSQRSIFIYSSHLRLGLSNGLLPSGFPTKALYAPPLSHIRATCPAHLSLLDLITRMIFGEECRAIYSYILTVYKVPSTLEYSLFSLTWKGPKPSTFLIDSKRTFEVLTKCNDQSLIHRKACRLAHKSQSRGHSGIHIIFFTHVLIGLHIYLHSIFCYKHFSNIF